MSACNEYRVRLLDHSLGEPAAPDLTAHLAGCPACAQELARLRSAGAGLDAAVRRLANPEPPPFLESRILARAPERRPWTSRLVAAAAVLALCLAAVWIVNDRQERQAEEAAAAISQWRSPTASLLYPPATPISSQGVLP